MEPEKSVSGRVFESAYMEWAKTRSRAKFNLATSGVPGYPLAGLGATLADLEINKSTSGYGFPPLQEAIGEEYGVPAECVVAGGGTSGANQYAMSLLLGPGDEALVEHPTYDILPNLALFTGASVRYFERRPENGWSVDPEELARLMTPRTKLIVLTNLHNPSSTLLDEATLTRIGEVAARHGALVMVDEVYLDCVWDARPRSAFHLGPNFLVTSSLTKVYGLSGLRCGWILAQPELAQRLWKLIDLFDNIPAHPAELLSVMAFRKLAEIRLLSRSMMDRNRAIYREFVEGPGAALRGGVPEYGTVVFPELPVADAGEFCDILRHQFETTVVPGTFFGMPSHVRISLVTQEETLREGLKRIHAALTMMRH